MAEWDQGSIHSWSPDIGCFDSLSEKLGPYFKQMDAALKCVAVWLVLHSNPNIKRHEFIEELKNVVIHPDNQLCTLDWFENFCFSKVSESKKKSESLSSDERIWRLFKRKREEWYSTFPIVFHYNSPRYIITAMTSSLSRSAQPKRKSIFGIEKW